jgi:hypothetical protein
VRLGLILTVALCALACAPAAARSQAPRPSELLGDEPDPAIANGSAQRRLDAARRRWRRAGIHNYRLDLDRACFCPPDDGVVIFVRNDRPVNAPATLRGVATILRLFRVVQGAIDDGVADLSVSYGRRGIPRRIRIDGHLMLSDDEVTYRVERFWRGTRGRGGPDVPRLPPGPGPVPR